MRSRRSATLPRGRRVEDNAPYHGLAVDALKGTHAYEIICSLGNRVERVYR